ncbi:hypothetical protein JTB14_007840 [Gonioctena quinquepunctata]|nr:hypothetical protein JTB14_007840 [Gonioctena quinquepunctata]
MVNFGCCKTRPFPSNYYICKNCLKIFHRSCVQQNKNKYNFLKDFQITCCSNDLDIIANDEKSLLELTINDLTQNSEMQNSYIEKLKQEQKILIEEVTQREEDQNEQIRYYQERIKVQKSEIADMRNTIDERDKKSRQTISTQTSITTNNKTAQTENDMKKTINCAIQTAATVNYEKRAIDLEMDIIELNNLMKNMLTSIETLTQENTLYRKKIDLLKNDLHFSNVTKKEGKDKIISYRSEVKRKILIVSNYRGRNLSIYLRKLLGDNYIIESIVKPNADDNELIYTVQHNADRLNVNDMVVLWPNKSTSDLVEKILIPLRNTRCTIITVPYRRNSCSRINDMIYKNNIELFKTAYQANLGDCLLECNNFLRKSNYISETTLNETGKWFLCKAIQAVIENPYTKSKSKSEKVSTINQSHFKSLNHRLYPDDSLAAEINEGTAGTTTSSVPSEAEVEETSKTKLKKMAFSIPKESSSGVSPSDTSFLGEKNLLL